MTYPDVFSIILLYNLYITIVEQSKLQTDRFVEIRKKENSHNKEHISKIIRIFAQQRYTNIKEVTLILIIIFLPILYKFSLTYARSMMWFLRYA